MHDAKGRELKVGDTVLIPCVIQSLSGDEQYCCLSVRTVGVMPGNRDYSLITALSTKQVYRADDHEVDTEERDGKVFLV